MQHPLKRKSAAAATSACGRPARRCTYTLKEGINKLVDILRLIIATRSQQFHVTGRPDGHGNARERGEGEKSGGTSEWVAVASDPNLLVYGVLSFLPQLCRPYHVCIPRDPLTFLFHARREQPLRAYLAFDSFTYIRVYSLWKDGAFLFNVKEI